MLSNKKWSVNFKSIPSLKCVGFVLLNKQSLLYTLGERGETLWVYEFQIIILHFKLVLNFIV